MNQVAILEKIEKMNFINEELSKEVSDTNVHGLWPQAWSTAMQLQLDELVQLVERG